MAGHYDQLCVFAGNSNPGLAQEICAYIGIPLGRAEVFKFSNDNTFVRIHESVRENDVFVVPSWHWYRNINESADGDLILFSVSDSPALEKLGFFRSQAKLEVGQIVDLVSDFRGMPV